MSKVNKELIQLNNHHLSTFTTFTDRKRIRTDILLNKDIRTANMHRKRHPASSIVREMQIKTTVRQHPHLPEGLQSKRQQMSNVGEDVERRGPVHRWRECKLVQPLWKTLWRSLKKSELPNDPAISLLRRKQKHYFEKTYAPLCSLLHYLQ